MPCKPVTKSHLYRTRVTEAAVRAVLCAVARVEDGSFTPEPLDYCHPDVRGQLCPPMRQSDRAVNWTSHTSEEIVRRVRAADSSPGVRTNLLDVPVYAYGAHVDDLIKGPAGQVVAQRHGAVCIATVDGAIWLTHLKARAAEHRLAGVKLPATRVLGRLVQGVPRIDVSIDRPLCAKRTYRDVRFWERGRVGYLAFDFYNGAMSTAQCRRLSRALHYARSRPTQIICLLGGEDFWSNGIHLSVIEVASDPAAESWRNINAIDDVVLQILTMPQIVVAGLRGNAGAGGVMLGLAADEVYARQGVVLNPHYRSMGNLYGSEYWTYSLPRRIGDALAQSITTACQPMGAAEACEIGMLDGVFGIGAEHFLEELQDRMEELVGDPALPGMLRDRRRRRTEDERTRPLATYRAQEFAHVGENFFGLDTSYHEARRRFVRRSVRAGAET